jgi:hypothetical protein
MFLHCRSVQEPTDIDHEGMKPEIGNRIAQLERLKSRDFSNFEGLTDIYCHSSTIKNIDAG